MPLGVVRKCENRIDLSQMQWEDVRLRIEWNQWQLRRSPMHGGRRMIGLRRDARWNAVVPEVRRRQWT